jgi:hypothetical protein
LPGGVLRWTVHDREASYTAQDPLVVDDESRLAAILRRAEAEAFAFSDRDVLRGLLPLLEQGPVSLDALPVENAADAVRVLHAVGAARSAEGRELRVQARKFGTQVRNEFFAADNFVLSARSADTTEPSTR